MSSCMPSWQACQEDFPVVLVQQMILHIRVAKAPVCKLPLLYTPCPCVVPVIPLPGISLLSHCLTYLHCMRQCERIRNTSRDDAAYTVRSALR